MEAFDISNLSFSYSNSDKKALSEINLTVNKGEFFVLCGYSGCGKTTLLRLLKPSLSPYGNLTGDILFCGKPLSELSDRECAEKIGFVQQSPETQNVTDKVWHELAFSLENLGYDNDTIRRRTAEMAAFFGIDSWFGKNVSELSGGQKQILALASAMVLKPEVLILDEPTSQLDPIAASEFLSVLSKVNRETGTTVILSEHRLEEAFVYADRAAVMENGKFLCVGAPREIGQALKNEKSPMFLAMPTPVRVWGSVETKSEVPLSISEGRSFIENYTKTHTINEIRKRKPAISGEEMLCAKEVWFRYEKELPDILKGLNFSAHRGEIFALLGSNGSGKTTSLKVLCGLRKALRGEIKRNGTCAYLPQNASALFVRKTVLEDLYDTLKHEKLSDGECEKRIEEAVSLCGIENILNCHPYDISGGQQQKAALAKILLLSPDILLLDEPTKALDAVYKRTFADILINLRNRGKCIVLVSHDIEFCAEFADTCALFFDGSLVSVSDTETFFSDNSFYTTAAERMAGDKIKNAVTASDVISAIGGKESEYYNISEKKTDFKVSLPGKSKVKNLSTPRKIGAGLSAFFALVTLIAASAKTDLMNLVTQGLTKESVSQLFFYGVFFLALVLLASFLSDAGSDKKIVPTVKRNKLSKRTVISSCVSLALVPVTVVSGLFLFDSKQYYITALLVIIECMLPFVFSFEGRKHTSKDIVILAVLSAIGVAGRAAFFMLPQFKPVAAIVIVTGIMLGAESGFLVGSVTMLVSNMLFSQGPWTPWQMFAMGMIGFISGIFGRKGRLGSNKFTLCLFGVIVTYIVYGGIVNASTALLWAKETLNLKILLSYYISGFPMDTVHALSTAVFLWFGAEPMMEILERVKVKYGIL